MFRSNMSAMSLLIFCGCDQKTTIESTTTADSYAIIAGVAGANPFRVFWDDKPMQVFESNENFQVYFTRLFPAEDKAKTFSFSAAAGNVRAASSALGIEACAWVADLGYDFDSIRNVQLGFTFEADEATGMGRLVRDTSHDHCSRRPRQDLPRMLSINLWGSAESLPKIIDQDRIREPDSVSRDASNVSTLYTFPVETGDSLSLFSKEIAFRNPSGDHPYTLDFALCLADTAPDLALTVEALSIQVAADGHITVVFTSCCYSNGVCTQ